MINEEVIKLIRDIPFIDVAHHSLNKKNEELCGDKIEVFKSSDKTIVILADGLGSGVKANILATLTTKIAITMLKEGASIEETIDTIMCTLPVCQVRKIAYSTFGIIMIDNDLNASIIEYDNPPIFFVRDNTLIQPYKKELFYSEKKVLLSNFKLQEGDFITLTSDGVIHAGVGNTLNHGWEWHHVGDFLKRQHLISADHITRRLIDTCNQLYGKSPGDDTSAVTIKVRKPKIVNIFSGPPENQSNDELYVDEFMSSFGSKILCGGTTANIFSRVLKRNLETSLDYIDPKIPPTAKLEGFDLVTEGVLTLKAVKDLFKLSRTACDDFAFAGKDGASKLFKILIDDSTHINFWIGKAINPAHQNPDFPEELSIKINIIKEIVEELRTLNKQVSVKFI